MRLFYSRISFLMLFLINVAFAENTKQAQDFNKIKKQVEDFKTNLSVSETHIEALKEDLLKSRAKQISDQYDQAIEEVLQNRNLSETSIISLLIRFIERNPSQGNLTAHALLTLAGQYFKKAESEFLASDEDKDVKNEQVFRSDLNKAIQIYLDLIKQFPNYVFIDIAYYLLGVCYAYQDKTNDAILIWQRLVEQFPESSLRDEVWFRLGEEKFNRRDFKAALLDYQQITNEQSGFYARALYKISWIYYVLNEFDKAIEGFTKVLDFQESQMENAEAALILKKEAEEYLAISFADVDTEFLTEQMGEEAKEQGLTNFEYLKNYFTQIGSRSYEKRVLLYFSDILAKLSKYEGAKAALFLAISLDPHQFDNPEMLSRLANQYEEAGLIENAIQIRQIIISDFGPGTDWFHKNQNYKDSFLSVKNVLRISLLQLATYEHTKAKDAKAQNDEILAKSLFESAAKNYLNYVNWFYSADDIDEVLLYLAEANFELSRFKDSAFAFVQVRDWPWETKHRYDAALNAVFSYHREIEKLQNKNQIPIFDLAIIDVKDKGRFVAPIPNILLEWVSNIDKFREMFPDDKELPNFLFEAASIFYNYGKIEEAELRLAQIVTLFPDLKVAKLAANLILEDKVSKGEWKQAALMASNFKKANIGGDSFEFHEVEINSRFKEAEKNFEEAKTPGQFEQAALLYLTLFKEDIKSPLADKMLYNAALALELSHKPDEANQNFEDLYSQFPRSPLTQKALLKVALYYEQSLQLEKAAKAYQKLSFLFPNTTESSEALLNTAILFEANHEDVNAQKAFKQFTLQYPNLPEAKDAQGKVDEIERQKMLFKAKERFEKLQKEFRYFESIKINAVSGKKQSKQLIDKTSLLASLEKKYKALSSEFPYTEWSLASFYQIGALYEGLYNSLIHVPCPQDVALEGEEACDEYQSLLEDKAFVLEQKALNSFKIAVGQFSLKHDNQWTKKIKDALHRLKPEEYPAFESPLFFQVLKTCPNLDEVKPETSLLALQKDPQNVSARLSMVRNFYLQGKFQAVLMALEDTKDTVGNQACMKGWLGLVDYQQGNWTDAIAMFEKAINETEHDLLQSDLYELLGNVYLMDNQNQDAIVSYKKSNSLNPNLVSVYYNWGLALMAQKDYLLAKDLFLKYLSYKSGPHEAKLKAENYVKILQQKIDIQSQKN